MECLVFYLDCNRLGDRFIDVFFVDVSDTPALLFNFIKSSKVDKKYV